MQYELWDLIDKGVCLSKVQYVQSIPFATSGPQFSCTHISTLKLKKVGCTGPQFELPQQNAEYVCKDEISVFDFL